MAVIVEDRDIEEAVVETRMSRSGRKIRAPRHLQQYIFVTIAPRIYMLALVKISRL